MRRVLAVIAVVAAGVAAAWWAYPRPAAEPAGGPRVRCPERIDAGSAEVGQTVEAVLPVGNDGPIPLTLSELSTDCSCLGAFILPDRHPLTHTPSHTVSPGGEAKVLFRLRVSGAHGVRTDRVVRFRTDDPDRPSVEVRIDFVPLARYFPDPVHLRFDPTDPDGPPAEFGVFATDAADRATVRAVVADDPGRLKVEWVPDPTDGPPVAAAGATNSRRLGRGRVAVAGPLDGGSVASSIRVYVDGRDDPVAVVAVAAAARTPVALAPAVLYLPRSSSAGPIYSATAICRTAGGPEDGLTVGPVPAGVAVEVEKPADSPVVRYVRVTCDPEARDVTIPLTVRTGGRDHPLALRVVVAPRPEVPKP
ncbi:MAG: hypothetical protein K2X87_15850 [Gemmataceae bacterium]|nr:hypothetical protein [Gemmataceae bacterium]